eukprot:364843-Chlamydomonas_euryale.AAC.4
MASRQNLRLTANLHETYISRELLSMRSSEIALVQNTCTHGQLTRVHAWQPQPQGVGLAMVGGCSGLHACRGRCAAAWVRHAGRRLHMPALPICRLLLMQRRPEGHCNEAIRVARQHGARVVLRIHQLQLGSLGARVQQLLAAAAAGCQLVLDLLDLGLV